MKKNFHYLFPMTSTTATVLLIARNEVDPSASKMLLGVRSHSAEVYPNTLCVPGGFLDAAYDDRAGECAVDTAVREVKEETNIDITRDQLTLFAEYSDPDADPRVHVTSLCYYAEITEEQAAQAIAGDDLQSLQWLWVGGDVPSLAFNHNVIVRDGLRAWNKEIMFRELVKSRDSSASLPSPSIVKTRRNIGLAVMRTQPLHKGHTRIIDTMIQDSDVAIIGMGSCNVSRTQHDPFTPEERKEMLRNVYGDRIKIVMLSDLGITPGKDDWVNYVLGKIRKLGLPEPSDYYSGSHGDSVWYKNRFVDYVGDRHPGWQYEFVREDGTVDFRRLHILDRSMNDVPAATDIRTLISMSDESWKKWVPRVNHKFIEEHFPDEFKIG